MAEAPWGWLRSTMAGHLDKCFSKDTGHNQLLNRAELGHVSSCPLATPHIKLNLSARVQKHTQHTGPNTHSSVQLQAARFPRVGTDCCFFGCASQVAGWISGAKRRARTRLLRRWAHGGRGSRKQSPLEGLRGTAPGLGPSPARCKGYTRRACRLRNSEITFWCLIGLKVPADQTLLVSIPPLCFPGSGMSLSIHAPGCLVYYVFLT